MRTTTITPSPPQMCIRDSSQIIKGFLITPVHKVYNEAAGFLNHFVRIPCRNNADHNHGRIVAAIAAIAYRKHIVLPEEIYFTSGGTEADNWAIKSAAKLNQNAGKHIISSVIEHHAVLHTLDSLKEQGYEITYLGVDEYGQISLQELRSSIKNGTSLISIMAANNEIGTILPAAQIGSIAREHGIVFHTDAVQAVGHIPINVRVMNIDMLSLAGHKFRGPKGIGALYVKKGLDLPAIIHGGGQEHNLRSGTENVAGIVGLGAALEEAASNMKKNMRKVSALRDKLISGVLQIPHVRLTGDPTDRLPGIASFAVEGVEGESMFMLSLIHI